MNPLQIKSDPENRNMRIETIVIVPRNCDDDAATGTGGSCLFVLPHRGYLSGSTSIIIPAQCLNDAFQYSPVAGCLSLCKQCTLRVGDTVVCQVDNSGQLYAIKEQTKHLERREQIEAVLKGVNSSFEGCSGGKRDAVFADKECLAGQYRLVASGDYQAKLPSTKVPGRQGARPAVMNAQLDQNLKLKTFYNDTATEAGTPEFSIELNELFPGFFAQKLQLPLGLINKQDEVSIEIVWSNNGAWANNERAIMCPELATGSMLTGCIAVASAANAGGNNGTGFGNNLVNQVATHDATTGAGSGLRIQYDTSAGGNPENIRVLDPGSGYVSGEQMTFNSPGGGANMFLYVAGVIRDPEANNNFYFGSAADRGTGYVAGPATLISVTNTDCYAQCTITVAAGAVQTCDIDNTPENVARFLCPGLEDNKTFRIEQTGSNNDAEATIASQIYGSGAAPLTTGALVNTFAVGNTIQVTGDATKTAVVLAIAANAPTVIGILTGDWSGLAPNIALTQVSAPANATCNITGAWALANQVRVDAGLGCVSLAGYDAAGTAKINIKADKVRMSTDLIFYEDGRMERDAEEMMSGEGLVRVYTQFRNVKSSVTGVNNIDAAGNTKSETVRLMGLSNEVMRSLLIQDFPSGTQSIATQENYNVAKKNPLLLDYCSRDSLVEDGVELQVIINSVPRYPAPIDFGPHFFTELAEVFQAPMYVPHGAYNGASSCKQRDTQALTDNSSQPGFQTLDSQAAQTNRYEINDIKAGIANQNFEGINQKYLRGFLKYYGLSFKKMPGNFQGNGIACGAQAIEVNYNYQHTQNAYYSGQSNLNMYAEVERLFQLKQGKVSVTNASM